MRVQRRTVLIKDEALALSPSLSRAHANRQARYDERLTRLNKRLCRAHRMVESEFGITSQKWRIFFRPIENDPSTAILLEKVACVLHNTFCE